MSSKPLPPLLAIVGPTASGKSALALRLAKRFGGEIVSADSRLLYKGMDIGTAKPSDAERRAVPHHLIDVLPPSKTLTAAEYKKKALRAIRGILRRGKLPILVGGTGLYVQALVENLEIPEVPPDPAYRAFLSEKGAAWMLKRLRRLDPAYAERIGPNPRYAARALEVIRATGKSFSAIQKKGEPLYEALLVGLHPEKPELERRIAARIRAMFRRGLEKEAMKLHRRYSWDLPAMSGIGYREFKPYFEGSAGLEEVKNAIRQSTLRYAKRQMTWWRRMKSVRWAESPGEAETLAKTWKKRFSLYT